MTSQLRHFAPSKICRALASIAACAAIGVSIVRSQQPAADSGTPANAPVSAADKQDIQELASFFVTSAPEKPFENGSNLDLPRTSNDIQPYTIINREAIEQSDATSLSSFLQNELTQDTTAQQFNQGAGGNAGNGTPVTAGGHTAGIGSVNLRGLGTAQTLVLVDGARIAAESFGGSEVPFNIDQVPLNAIDHIEVMPSSASAIYGSSAVGGVINIVLKKNFTGGEIDAGYGNTFNTDSSQRTFGIDYGFSLDKSTQVTIVAGYSDAKTPLLQDRSFLVDRLDHVIQTQPTLLGGSGVFTLGSTPNIVLDTAVVSGYTDASTKTLTLKNGTALNATSTYIPPGTSPSTAAATLAAGLLTNAGTQNYSVNPLGVYNGLQQQIEPFPRNESFMASIDHKFSDALEAYGDFGITQMKLITLFNGDGGSNTAGANEPVIVPGSAANNPFADNVFMSIPTPASQGMRVVNTNIDRYATVGLLAHLPANWEVVGEYSLTGASFKNFYQQVYFNDGAAATTAALGAANQAILNGAFNPFVDTVQYPQNYGSYVTSNYEWYPSELSDLNLRASGPIFVLPGGSAKLTIGLEDRANIQGQGLFLATEPALPNTTQTTPFSDIRDIFPGTAEIVHAAYLETEIPIVSPKNNVPFVNDLEFQAAGRAEGFNTSSTAAYSAVLAPTPRVWSKYSSTNPTLGLKWSPIKSLIFRTSYAAGFVPPRPDQVEPSFTAVPANAAAFYDPKLNEENTTAQTLSLGGNPDLKPQSSKSYDVGVIWTPGSGPLVGLRANLEFYEIREYNLIQAPSVQITVDTPALQNYVVRAPTTGVIDLVYLQDQNVSKEYTNGWDASLDYSKQTSIGTFSLHTAATLIEHLKEPPAPGDPLVEYVGFVNAVDGGADKVKANGTLRWLVGHNWTFSWTTLYYDSYKQYGAPSDPQYGGAAAYTPNTLYLVPQGADYIPSQIYHNLFVSYRFGDSSTLWHALDRTTLQVGVNDVFNTAPPFDAFAGAATGSGSGLGIMFYSPYGSPLLRQYVLKVKKTF